MVRLESLRIAGAVTRYEKVGCILKHLTELHGDRTLRVARRVKNVCDSIAKSAGTTTMLRCDVKTLPGLSAAARCCNG
jgi:hypothetical protein